MHITTGCPPYVGYYFGLGERVSFTETDAEVFSYTTQNKKIYPVKLDFSPEMPPKEAFSAKRRIKWYLRQGFKPDVQGGQIAFVKTHLTAQSLKHESRRIRREITRALAGGEVAEPELQNLHSEELELLATLVDDFEKKLDERPDIALACVKMAFEKTKAVLFKRLLAEYYLYRKNPDAAKLFFELYKITKDRLDLEKAMLTSPSNEDVLNKIKHFTGSQEVKVSLLATGFLASQCQETRFCELAGISAEMPQKDFVAKFYHARELDRQTQEAQSPPPQPRGVVPLIKEAVRQRAPTLSRLQDLTKRRSGASEEAEHTKEVKRNSVPISSTDLSGARVVRNTECIAEIDALIQAKMQSRARQKIEAAIAECGKLAPLYERLLLIEEDPALVNEWLKELLLTPSLSDEKVEYVTQLLYTRLKSFEFGMQCAELYAKQNRNPECAKLLFELAKTHSDKVNDCLELLDSVNPGYTFFSESEIRLLVLLGMSVGKQELVPLKSPERRFEDIATVAHTGESTFFCCDHPHYVACWLNLDMRILFTKERAEVYHFSDGTLRVLPLDFPPSVPDEVRFFSADVVRWLLGRAYRPIISDSGVTFVHSHGLTCEQEFLQRAAAKKELSTFIRHFQEGNYGLAHAEIQNVQRQHPQCDLGDLYAEFYAFLQRPEAIKRFLAMSRGDDALYYLQRALSVSAALKDPQTYSIYLKIYELLHAGHFNLEQEEALCLHAYMYFTLRHQDHERATFFYEKAPAVFRLLARIASLDRPKEYTLPSTLDTVREKYRIVKQTLIDFCVELSRGTLQDYFTSDRFLEQRNALSVVVLDIKNSVNKQLKGQTPDTLTKQLATIQYALQQLEFMLEEKNYHGARDLLFDARNALLPAETITRKNAYLELEKATDSPFYRAKILCHDYRGKVELSNAFTTMTNTLPERDLEAIFTSDEFRRALDALPEKLRKVDLEELKAKIGELQIHIRGRNFSKAEKTLCQMHDMPLPPIAQGPVNDLYFLYSDCPLKPTVEGILSQVRIEPIELPTKYTLIEKCTSLPQVGLLIQADQYDQAEVWLLGAIDQADAKAKKQLRDLYVHLLLYLGRSEVVDLCFEHFINSSGWARQSCKNKIYTNMASEPLFYLGLLVEFCVKHKDPQLNQVYEKIVDSLKNVPQKVVSLVYLHAFFQYIEHDRKLAEEWFKNIDPAHPLYPCARLALLDPKAKSLRMREYNKMKASFEDRTVAAEYVGNGATSALEPFVHAQCLKLYRQEQNYRIKELGVVFVDTLIEGGHFERANDMIELVCRRLNIATVDARSRYSFMVEDRTQAGRYSFLKREAVTWIARKNPAKAETALRKIFAANKEAGKTKKRLLCARLLYKQTNDFEMLRELVVAIEPQERLALYLDFAIKCLIMGRSILAKQVVNLIVKEGKGSEDQQLMLKLIQSILGVQEIQQNMEALRI